MILKVVEYEQRDNTEGAYEVVNYIDGITNASVTFDETIELPTVKCTIDNAAVISISVPSVAYLMNNNGKTIDRIAAPKFDGPESDGVFPELHDAISEAVNKSME